MNAERYRQLEQLFQAARAMDASERSRWLDDKCADDRELRDMVEELLSHDASPAHSFEALPWVREIDPGAVAGRALDDVACAGDAAHPEQLGPYRIVKLIGEGGMGVVYEAEQDDPRRRVALKVIRSGLVTPRLAARFRREAQVLGHLRHPGIAQIYAAGTAPAENGGHPYFAMELVDGLPLRRHVELHALDHRGRLELVARICDALDHAHGKGIVHRDLKPANVLVEPGPSGGQPRILDFGVARITNADVLTVTVQTQTGELVGTVPYMSPEQASGDPSAIDLRSDLYALGVIAFELLSGQMPYEVQGKLIHEAVRVIQHDEPSRLGSIDRALRGDVEVIVAKALEKDKTRRYQSAAQMAADIRRYLRDEPIVARPPSTIYQLGKFARRHRALVSAVAAIIVVLLAATLVATTLALRESQARKGEAEARLVAEAVNEFLNDDLLGAVSPDEQGRDVTMLEALDVAAAKIEGRFPDQPLVEAGIRSTIGNTYLALGRADLTEPHFLRALELHRQAIGEVHEDTVRDYNRLGRLMQTVGRLDDAERYYAKCLDLRRQTLGLDAPLTLTTQINLAGLLRQAGRFDEALALYVSGVDIAERTLEPEAEQRLNTMTGLAGAYKDLGRYEEAIPIYQRIVEVRRRTAPDKPALGRSLNNLAVAYMRADRLTEARDLFTEALERSMANLTERHPTTAAIMTNLARVQGRLGELDLAESQLQRSLALHRDLLGHDHRGTLITQGSLAQVYRDMDRLDDAEAILREVVALSVARYGDNFPGTITSRHDLAAIYLKLDRPADALPVAAQAAAAARDVYGEHSTNTAIYLQAHALALLALDRPDEAAPLLEQAHAIFDQALGPDHPDTLEAAGHLESLRKRALR